MRDPTAMFPRPVLTTTQLSTISAHGTISMSTQSTQHSRPSRCSNSITSEYNSNITRVSSSFLKLQYEVATRDTYIKDLLAEVNGQKLANVLLIAERNALLDESHRLEEDGEELETAVEELEREVEAWLDLWAICRD